MQSKPEVAAGPEAVACAPCVASGMPGFGVRIGVSLAFAGQGMIFGLGYNNALRAGEAPAYGSTAYVLLHAALLVSAVAVAALLGGPLLRASMDALRARRLTVEAMFVLSAAGALAGSLISSLRGSGSVYYEVVSVVLCVYAIGKQIGVVQKGRVGQAIASLRQAFDRAVVAGPGGAREARAVADLRPGECVLVGPGDPVAVDGVIESGAGYVRETALTGEPAPVRKCPGDAVLAGTWSLDGHFTVRPRLGSPRLIDGILGVLEGAPLQASRLQESADRLMQVFVPLVASVAGATFIGWLMLSGVPWWEALFNAMAVLLVACPCALGLAMPAGLWGGLYYLGQRGIIGRSGHLLDSLAECRTVVFDKTGTLSEFDLQVDASQLTVDGPQRERVLAALAGLGRESHHPVSGVLAALTAPAGPVRDLRIHPGLGVEAVVGELHVMAGEAALLQGRGIATAKPPAGRGKPVHVAVAGAGAGFLLLQERLRPEAADALQALQALGCRCIILSGDPNPLHTAIGGVPVEAGLTPSQKAARVREQASGGGRVLFVGDGINDVPAMQAADAALAIDLGAALATEFADGVLVGGRVGLLPGSIRHARRLMRGLRANLRFALAYNCIGMGFAAAGLLHPVGAAFLMVGSSAFVSWRALRAARGDL